MTVGKLPSQLAIMINNTALIENLVVEACMEKNKSKVKWAVCHDPLTSAVCSLEEINQMCDELFEINKEFYRRAKKEMLIMPENRQIELEDWMREAVM